MCFTWVKGHATLRDVQCGRVLLEDKQGNDAADALAVKGAPVHAVPSAILQRALQRKEDALAVQKMMLRILAMRDVRAAALAAPCEPPADDASDDPCDHDCIPVDAG